MRVIELLKVCLVGKVKYQITVPKEERQRLNLQPSDAVALVVNSKSNEIVFEMYVGYSPCPICHGRGKVTINDECFVCENGRVRDDAAIKSILADINARKYHIGFSIKTEDDVPKVTLSAPLSAICINRGECLLPVKVIDDYTPRNSRDPKPLMTSSD